MNDPRTLVELLQSTPLTHKCVQPPHPLEDDGDNGNPCSSIASSILVNESAASIMSESNFANCFLEEEKQFSCKVCDYCSHHKYIMTLHERTHTGERPIICEVCDYATSYPYSMVIHKRTHSGEKPYKCSMCDFATAYNGTFRQHERSHTGDKPYKCDDCDYRAPNQYRLNQHKLIHSNLKPFKCRMCTFKSKQPGNITRHELAQHLGAKQHKCSICPYTASRGYSLKLHMGNHHQKKD